MMLVECHMCLGICWQCTGTLSNLRSTRTLHTTLKYLWATAIVAMFFQPTLKRVMGDRRMYGQYEARLINSGYTVEVYEIIFAMFTCIVSYIVCAILVRKPDRDLQRKQWRQTHRYIQIFFVTYVPLVWLKFDVTVLGESGNEYVDCAAITLHALNGLFNAGVVAAEERSRKREERAAQALVQTSENTDSTILPLAATSERASSQGAKDETSPHTQASSAARTGDSSARPARSGDRPRPRVGFQETPSVEMLPSDEKDEIAEDTQQPAASGQRRRYEAEVAALADPGQRRGRSGSGRRQEQSELWLVTGV